MSLMQFDLERKVTGAASNRKPLIAHTLSNSLLRSYDSGSQFAPKLLIFSSHAGAFLSLDKLSQYMTDAHANVAADFPQGLIHNISLMITGPLHRQGGDEVKDEDIMV